MREAGKGGGGGGGFEIELNSKKKFDGDAGVFRYPHNVRAHPGIGTYTNRGSLVWRDLGRGRMGWLAGRAVRLRSLFVGESLIEWMPPGL